ncbi:acyl-CoA thioesterase [Mucilaginibacter sp. X5P1]|uniref:acyl-CoA thioesterase n=1 Tax=Mucilaginibacter sp. X5P1 TaxID=2723088 RepID=UPI0016190233|nr:acyl-CoA thioesterase [Mucilaginibacter sp. X5P1]MBB6139319.1 acyl-CoA thioester hydrolase [Mucilaginibacter sp. X5P1]
MKKILTSITKVRFQDCDPFNHLNNSKYIDYFINAREDQLLENYNLDIFRMADQESISWVVSASQICYLRPAFTMESILIDSQLIAYTSKSLMVELRMWDEKQSKLKSMLWTNFVHYNLRTQKPMDHSAELSKLFGDILLPVEQTTFEDRRNYLKQSNIR